MSSHSFLFLWKLAAAVVLLLSMSAPVRAGFTDATANDQAVAYKYLEAVEKEVGTAEFERIPFEICLKLTKTLGSIDRYNLSGKGFMVHLRHVDSIKSRFYAAVKLMEEEVNTYLRPFRIRYEGTENANWLSAMAAQFGPITKDTGTAGDAANLIFAWMDKNLQIIEPSFAYPVPLREDWDPVKVLKERKGMEIDLAIFGIAALRSVGIASRFVWAPALRGEVGGKGWLEYLNEGKQWVPWVPSFRKTKDHLQELRKQIGAKILFVVAKPEAPVEVTSSYVETAEITFDAEARSGSGVSQPAVNISMMVLGKNGLLSARGNEPDDLKSETTARVGLGAIYIVASFSKKGFALLPIVIKPGTQKITIRAADGLLSVVEPSTK